MSKNARLITLYFFLFFFFNIANAAAAPPRTTTVIAEMLIIAVLPLNHPPFFIFSFSIGAREYSATNSMSDVSSPPMLRLHHENEYVNSSSLYLGGGAGAIISTPKILPKG